MMKRGFTNKGFTLVELLVATALFSVVVTTAVGSMLTTIDAYRRARASQTAVDNLNFALESMSRAIRQGSSYSTIAGSAFSFTNAVGASVAYSFAETNGIGEIRVSTNGSAPLPLTATELDVDVLQFNPVVSGSQDRVRIFVRGTAGAKETEKQDFYLQTTITQRN